MDRQTISILDLPPEILLYDILEQPQLAGSGIIMRLACTAFLRAVPHDKSYFATAASYIAEHYAEISSSDKYFRFERFALMMSDSLFTKMMETYCKDITRIDLAHFGQWWWKFSDCMIMAPSWWPAFDTGKCYVGDILLYCALLTGNIGFMDDHCVWSRIGWGISLPSLRNRSRLITNVQREAIFSGNSAWIKLMREDTQMREVPIDSILFTEALLCVEHAKNLLRYFASYYSAADFKVCVSKLRNVARCED